MECFSLDEVPGGMEAMKEYALKYIPLLEETLVELKTKFGSRAKAVAILSGAIFASLPIALFGEDVDQKVGETLSNSINNAICQASWNIAATIN